MIMDFPSNLKDIRKRVGLTQLQLAEKIGLSLGTIRNWEQGVNVPKYPAMKTLSETLGVSLAELTGLEDGEPVERGLL